MSKDVHIGTLGGCRTYLMWKDVKDICNYEVKQENNKLKSLLKECREALGFAQGFYGYCKIKNYPCVNTNNFKDDESKIETCLTKIDEALK